MSLNIILGIATPFPHAAVVHLWALEEISSQEEKLSIDFESVSVFWLSFFFHKENILSQIQSLAL